MTTETDVKERPILFSGPMVKALLDGSKTQTRRMVKPQREIKWFESTDWGMPRESGWFAHIEERASDWDSEWHSIICPKGKPGDRLWVRETWALIRGWDDDSGCIEEWSEPMPKTAPDSDFTYHGDPLNEGCWGPTYRADNEWPDDRDERGFDWRPSIFMPRWASRITLEITNVRVERLQDISHEDAMAEGVDTTCDELGRFCPIIAYRNLWNSINGAGSWDANPWAWAYTFKRILTEPQ